MKLTFNDIFPILKAHFPQRNNYYPCSYKEEYEELLHFNIDTTEKLETLISTHKESLLQEDASVELDPETYDFFCDDMGKSIIDERLEQQYWYSYPALLRLALEKEFGAAYDDYAFGRDGIEVE